MFNEFYFYSTLNLRKYIEVDFDVSRKYLGGPIYIWENKRRKEDLVLPSIVLPEILLWEVPF